AFPPSPRFRRRFRPASLAQPGRYFPHRRMHRLGRALALAARSGPGASHGEGPGFDNAPFGRHPPHILSGVLVLSPARGGSPLRKPAALPTWTALTYFGRDGLLRNLSGVRTRVGTSHL